MDIYGFSFARSLRACWAAEEAGISYTYNHVGLSKGEGRKEPYISLNPGGKVPSLVDGDLVLTESAAICSYLGATAERTDLVPVDVKKRALYDKWCFFACTELEQPLWTQTKHTYSLPKDKRVEAVIETARWEFGVAAKVLTKGLGSGPYILGDDFTMADVLIGHTLSWAMSAGFFSEEFEVLQQYHQRLTGREAFMKAVGVVTQAAG